MVKIGEASCVMVVTLLHFCALMLSHNYVIYFCVDTINMHLSCACFNQNCWNWAACVVRHLYVVCIVYLCIVYLL